jgi:hypothetical protein
MAIGGAGMLSVVKLFLHESCSLLAWEVRRCCLCGSHDVAVKARYSTQQSRFH